MSGRKPLNVKTIAIVVTAFLVVTAVVLFVYSESKAKSASSDLEYYFIAEVSDANKQLVEPDEDETYTLKANTAYKVSLTADGTVNNGYCKVLTNKTDDVLTTQQIARKSTITFTLIPEKDAAYTFLAVTGTNVLSADITDSCTIGTLVKTEETKTEETTAAEAETGTADTSDESDSSDWYDDDDDYYWYDDDDDYSYSYSYSTPSSSSSSGSSSSGSSSSSTPSSSSTSSAASTPSTSSSSGSSSGSSSESSSGSSSSSGGSSTIVDTPIDSGSSDSGSDSGSSDSGDSDSGEMEIQSDLLQEIQ